MHISISIYVFMFICTLIDLILMCIDKKREKQRVSMPHGLRVHKPLVSGAKTGNPHFTSGRSTIPWPKKRKDNLPGMRRG